MSKEERAALFNKPNPRDESIRRITGAAPPPARAEWGSSSSTSVTEGVEGLNLDGGAEAEPKPSGGKKKGKQKQLLFSVSARP